MFTEREKVPSVPKEVVVIPENPTIPEEIEAKDGVKVVMQQQNIPSVTNTGSVSTAKDATVTVTLPADPAVLQTTIKKGNIVDAMTWLAVFWLRMFKKALHFGWQVERKN